ncbi:beta-ketoacyl synthase N-terminal-like domain-containing protein [Citricoccus nitrophenolicus]|uniref:beta-ketoacyl synthase N-terminal-like domain-containing protein n=1 Tax=Citricoccus nitrophenolicus TaxID=863575 RepID=UPI0031EBE73C
MDDNDVVVTGLGAITPLGADVGSLWTGMIEGRSGVRSISDALIPGLELPVTIAAPMPVSPADLLDPIEAKRLDRSQQAALVAAREAWSDAGTPEVESSRLAVVIGTGIGGGTHPFRRGPRPPAFRSAARFSSYCPDADDERSSCGAKH